MLKFKIEGKELWVTTYTVEAETEEDAKQSIKDGEYEDYKMNFEDFLGFRKIEQIKED